MSHQMTHRGKSSFFSPALRPAIFVLALTCLLAVPAAAEELTGKGSANVGHNERPHPVHPRYELSATELEFGDVAPGESSEMSVTVTNTSPGTIPLKVSLSRGCDGFSLSDVSGMHHLRSGESVEITVGFAPMEPGDFDCYLNLGQQVPAVALSGTGVQTVTGISLDLVAFEFGEVIVDSTGTLHLKITNTGADTYTLDPSLTDDPTDFSIREGLNGFALMPGGYVYLTMYFTPTVSGPHESVLSLGAGWPRLDVTGTGLEPIGACIVSPDNLVFGPLSPGESQMQSVKITNTGNINLPISPIVNDPNFSVSRNSTTLLPGHTWIIAITYSPKSWGTFQAQVDLGNEYCVPVECTGLPTENFDTDLDNVGLFFDEGLTENRTTTTESFEVVDFHLAMLNPSVTAGIAGWECRLGIEGEASIVFAEFAGNAINAGSGNEFSVGIGLEPLPYSPAILLASFRLVVQGPPGDTVELELRPKFRPSVPGLMAWVSWDDLHNLKPMFPVDGNPVVAIINDPAASGSRLAGAALNKSADGGIPAITRILPNTPNPFNPQTEIRFELATAGQARLAIFNVTGRLVKTMHHGHLASGPHSLLWQGRDDGGRPVASGVYYLRMETAEMVQHRKMMLLK